MFYLTCSVCGLRVRPTSVQTKDMMKVFMTEHPDLECPGCSCYDPCRIKPSVSGGKNMFCSKCGRTFPYEPAKIKNEITVEVRKKLCQSES